MQNIEAASRKFDVANSATSLRSSTFQHTTNTSEMQPLSSCYDYVFMLKENSNAISLHH
jgi:hypothetical protein